MDEAEVVVDGRPDMDVKTESLGEEVELEVGEEGSSETKVMLG